MLLLNSKRVGSSDDAEAAFLQLAGVRIDPLTMDASAERHLSMAPAAILFQPPAAPFSQALDAVLEPFRRRLETWQASHPQRGKYPASDGTRIDVRLGDLRAAARLLESMGSAESRVDRLRAALRVQASQTLLKPVYREGRPEDWQAEFMARVEHAQKALMEDE